MRKVVLGVLLVWMAVVSGTCLAVSNPDDVEGSKDPALFTRMPGFYIGIYEEKEFDRYEFPVNRDYQMNAVEGHCYYLQYNTNESAKLPGGLQVVRNYANAALAAGGTKIAEFEDGGVQYVTLKITKGEAETWALIGSGGGDNYSVHIVEKGTMRQDVVADASSLAGAIKSTGKAAVYGIYFDTGKAEVKAESEPSLKEIAKLLQNDSALKLYVVGHTDNTGVFDANVKLSNDRAASVVKSLTGKYAVAAARLKPFGAGPTAPVASNQTEDGKAKNRRVELVAQ